MRDARNRAGAAKGRLQRSAAGDLWSRLQAVDFINQAFILAGLLLLCVLPFLIVVSAIAGVDFVDNVSRRMALNDEASQDVRKLFGPTSGTLASVQTISVIWLAITAVSVASVVQGFYLRVFGVDPGGLWRVWRWPVWVLMVICASASAVAMNEWLDDLGGGTILVPVVDFCVAVAFWWWSLRFFLARKRSWRYLFPAALATTICFAGLRVVSSIFFSSAIVANEKQYGSIGVVFIIMTWLVAVGVVILIGAVVGVVWRERRPVPGTAPPGATNA